MANSSLSNNSQNKPAQSNKPLKAGGFSSLKSTIKHIIDSQQPKTNIKNLLKANKDKGFDCPGCAWGDETEGLLQFCENGAKAIAWESTSKKADGQFFKNHSVSYLKKQSDYWLEYQGRLTEPLRYNSSTDHYEIIDWQDAFKLIAQHLTQLSSPNQAEFYTSGRASNEAAFIYQLFGRMFGTNNFPDCSNMCHEASGVALNESIGIGKGTVTLADFDHADAILVFGQNPGTNHPRMMNALRKSARSGCKIVSFNNLKEVALERFASPQDPIELLTSSATTISHLYLTPKLGGDMAAVRGICKHIFEKNEKAITQGLPAIIDNEFIAQHTDDFSQYQQQVAETSWQKIEQQSGLSQAELLKAAELYLQAERVICTWAMGITQHKHSVDTIQEIVNLQLLKGNIGKKGAGLCPVRGHSNVQGNRTVGINEKPSAEFITALAQLIDKPLPFKGGHNVYHALKALLDKTSKVIICLGGNIAAAAPDTQQTFDALCNSELNVQISTKLNRSHLAIGKDALILPCLGRTEIDNQASGSQYITVEDTFSMVHASQGNVPPLSSEQKSEIAIVAGIAEATLGNKEVNWQALSSNYDLIREMIGKTLPAFFNFNNRLNEPGGFYLGNSAANLQWKNQAGKALFSHQALPNKLVAEHFQENQKNQIFTLQTLRSHDQYNTTVYGMNDRYRGISNDRNVVFINAKDAKKLNFLENDLVTITSIWSDDRVRSVSGFKIKIYDIPQGNLAAYYPETNPLVPLDSVGDRSFTPTSKAIAVMLEKTKSERII